MVDDVADLVREARAVIAGRLPSRDPAAEDEMIARLADALEARAPEFPNPIRCDNPVANGERKEADPVTGMAPVGSASTNLARAPESGGAVADEAMVRSFVEQVATNAYYAGFVECSKHTAWDDMFDWAILIAAKYAKEDEEVQRFAAALAQPAGRSGGEWRPIATAPRDGTRILAFNEAAGIYSTAFTTRWTGEPYERGYEGFPCGFWSTGLGSYPFGRWDVQPTFWMPPPAPPTGEPG